MGSPVLQGQHPHSQLNPVRKKAQSQIQRGSAASAWGAEGMVGAAPPRLTRSPGGTSRYMSVQDTPWLPKSLKSRNWGAKKRIQGKRNPPISLQGR